MAFKIAWEPILLPDLNEIKHDVSNIISIEVCATQGSRLVLIPKLL